MNLPTHSNPNPPTNLAQGDIVAFIGYGTDPEPALVRIVSVRDDAAPILYTIEFEGGTTRFNADFFWDIGELVKQAPLEIPLGSLGLMLEWSSLRGEALITTSPGPQEEGCQTNKGAWWAGARAALFMDADAPRDSVAAKMNELRAARGLPEPTLHPQTANDPYVRLVDEHAQLDERLKKLTKFLSGGGLDGLSTLQCSLLHHQHDLMTELEAVLHCRIATWVHKEAR